MNLMTPVLVEGFVKDPACVHVRDKQIASIFMVQRCIFGVNARKFEKSRKKTDELQQIATGRRTSARALDAIERVLRGVTHMPYLLGHRHGDS